MAEMRLTQEANARRAALDRVVGTASLPLGAAYRFSLFGLFFAFFGSASLPVTPLWECPARLVRRLAPVAFFSLFPRGPASGPGVRVRPVRCLSREVG